MSDTVSPRPANRMLKVMMLGLRGCPDVQGGVERHVEQLAPRLARLGCEVEVIARRAYVDIDGPVKWNGIKITPLPGPTSRSLEAIVHTFLGVLNAAVRRPDILHIHAIGPALMAPLARMLGLTVVVTHHGYDYDRAKWGGFAKSALRLGEWAGMRFASARIAVSKAIAGRMAREYGVGVLPIPNGVPEVLVPTSREALGQFGLDPGRYALTVGRMVPEKRHLDLIDAFSRAKPEGWKLVLVGGADHRDAYVEQVETAARSATHVVMTGVQTGSALAELFGHAGLFVLPSSHEGLPIALLEAMSYGVPCIASDIEANAEVLEDAHRRFPVGDLDRLAALIQRQAVQPSDSAQADAQRAYIRSQFNWDAIAEATVGVYNAARGRRPLLGSAATVLSSR